jgi:hypothetical protein
MQGVDGPDEYAAIPVVWYDYGEVGKGVSSAHHVALADDSEWIIKGPVLSPNNPFVGVNELIAAQLASLLRLPVLKFRLVRYKERICFASAWLKRDQFDFMTPSLLTDCWNRDHLHGGVSFDSWILNEDRHLGNLLARRVATGLHVGEVELLFNDHSHALLAPPAKPFHLAGKAQEPDRKYRPKASAICECVNSRTLLVEAVERIEGMSAADIEGCVRNTPHEWLNGRQKQQVAEFLVLRRTEVRNSFRSTLPIYAAMNGGSL